LILVYFNFLLDFRLPYHVESCMWRQFLQRACRATSFEIAATANRRKRLRKILILNAEAEETINCLVLLSAQNLQQTTRYRTLRAVCTNVDQTWSRIN